LTTSRSRGNSYLVVRKNCFAEFCYDRCVDRRSYGCINIPDDEEDPDALGRLRNRKRRFDMFGLSRIRIRDSDQAFA
jgi:hypothetical protein